MNREVLAETRVSDLTLQFRFRPGTFSVRSRVWGKLQAGAIQVQETYDSDQVPGIEISLGTLGKALQVVGAPREPYRFDANRTRESRVKPALKKRG